MNALPQPTKRVKRALLWIPLLAASAAASALFGSVVTAGAHAAASPAPGKGGKLVWAASLPSTWDPITSTAGTDVTALSLVYSGLTKMDAKGRPVPDLASGWSWSKNGLALTFTLRPGLVFSDGTKLDAKAVTQNILRGRDDPKSLIAPQLAPIASASAPDATTVKLKLKTPDYDLLRVLAGKTGELVSPKAFTTNAGGLSTQPVGSGPFNLTNLVSGSSATLVRNPGYWNAKQILLSELDLRFVTNPQTVVASLKTGDINMAWLGTNTVIPALLGQPGIKIDVVPSLRAYSIEVNQAMAPFTNFKVVQAVNYAIDRQTIVKTILGSIGKISYQAFPRGYVGYSQEAANLYPYDPAKAKSLLAAAGYANGGPAFTITYFDYGSFKALAQLLQSELNAVGFQTSLSVLPLAQAAQAVYVDHSVAFNPNGISGRESPLQMLQVQYAADGLLNPCRCAPSKLTAAFKAVAKVPVDSKQYPALLQKATALSAKTSANIFIATQPWVYAHSTSVQGLQPYLVTERFEGVYVDQQ
ncbi:MAG: ABC transporter substrate-binding protein [Actinomycetota bacterium]|nr:ABC transporter substrate-binding protein [Actinomycetota bacterium]